MKKTPSIPTVKNNFGSIISHLISAQRGTVRPDIKRILSDLNILSNRADLRKGRNLSKEAYAALSIIGKSDKSPTDRSTANRILNMASFTERKVTREKNA